MGSLAKQLRFVFLGTVLVVAAFSTGISFLFFLVYLLGGLLLAAWLYARRGLQGLRAGYHVLNPRAQVGEVLQAVYRLDNETGWGKPWVELWNDSTLPAPLPGRVIGVAARGSRQWLAKVTLLRRGSYRLGALRVRTGDPFGLFTSEMVVGQPTWVVVFPKVHELPHWRLPPSPVDGTAPSRRRFEAASPLVSSIRPYVHGDAINRIHWLSSVRHSELHVKEFDLEQTADLSLLLDLERSAHAGVGESASVEAAVSAAASIAVQTLQENRSVGDDGLVAPAAHPDPGPRHAGRAEDPAPAGQRPGRWLPPAGRSPGCVAAAAAPRHDAVHRDRLHRSRVGPRPGLAAPSRGGDGGRAARSRQLRWPQRRDNGRALGRCATRWPSTTSPTTCCARATTSPRCWVVRPAAARRGRPS